MQAEAMNQERAPLGLRAVALLAVLAGVALALGRGLFGELVYDDLWLIARNPALEDFGAFLQAATQAHWDFIEPDLAQRIGYWRPLALFALYLGRQVGGGDPLAYHALALGFHLAATSFVYLLAQRLFGPRELLVPLVAAALFGLHPLHVESTAWVSALNDPMSGCFVLASVWSFVRWRQRGSRSAPIAATACFALALFSKESSLAWFLLAPLADYATRVGPRPLVRAYLPALVVAALYVLARVQVFEHWMAGFDRVTSYLHESSARHFTLRVELLGGALALLAWPAKLNLFREVRPEIPWDDAQLWTAVAALAVWCALVFVAWRRKQHVLLFGLLVMLAAFAPAALRYESIGRFPLSDRFLYVSASGAALAVAWLASKLPRPAALALFAALAVPCAAKSFQRTAVWKDELTLFEDGARQSPRSMYVQWGLGRVLLARFQATGDPLLLVRANLAFSAAQDLSLERDPTVLDTLFDELQASLGVGWYHLFCALHMPEECTLEEAEMVFRALSQKAQTSPDVRCGLGVALSHLGRVEEAKAELRKALEYNPLHQQSWFNLGRIALDHEQWSEALEQFQRCVELAPDDVDAWVCLGMAAIELDLGERARQALGRARALGPQRTEPLVQLGVMAAREGRPAVALDFFEQALKINGSHGPAHLMRAKALVQLQRIGDALQAFTDAARWLQEPSSDPRRPYQIFEAFYNAGVLTLQRSPKDALPILEQALARDPSGAWSPALRGEVEKLRQQFGDG